VFAVPKGSMSRTCASSSARGRCSTREDEELTLAKLDVAVAKLDRRAPLEHQEEVVGLIVLVPDELALHLHDEDVVVVQLSDGLRLPVTVERGQLVREIDSAASAASSDTPVNPKDSRANCARCSTTTNTGTSSRLKTGRP
jgi:hypothetical protein